jgi:hypothetical protein
LSRGVAGNAVPPPGNAFPSPFGIRPIGYRRAPGLAVTGRLDTPVRPRSSSAHPTVQRGSGNKEAIPLTELSASADHSQSSDQQVCFPFSLFIIFQLLRFFRRNLHLSAKQQICRFICESLNRMKLYNQLNEIAW